LDEPGAFICWKEEGAVWEKMESMDTCTEEHEKWLQLSIGTLTKQAL
jgi:hypothetical protein